MSYLKLNYLLKYKMLPRYTLTMAWNMDKDIQDIIIFPFRSDLGAGRLPS